MSVEDEASGIVCAPLFRHSTIQLAHGGGGRALRELVESVFLPAFTASVPAPRHDSAVLPAGSGRLAFTTDAFVVRPLFFPGGDIGTLAVNGTVNDLAMAGAVPQYLSASFVLEEGLELVTLERVVRSMADAALAAGVAIVTGDTKVVERGHGDGIYIATSGIGRVEDGVEIAPSRIRPGDAIIVSGDVGRHGVAVLSVREGLGSESALESDCRELGSLVRALFAGGIVPHCLRDLTRGGLAAGLCELALDGGFDFRIDAKKIPIVAAVNEACERLGLDPLYVACEGRCLVFVAEAEVTAALAALSAAGAEPAVLGVVEGTARTRPGRVELDTALGEPRVLELSHGEPLPRIS
jgi:hydrogenase expression/formation protein HypE